MFSNRIEIYNPGTFPDGVTPEDYIKGVEEPIHRNPLLAQIMYYSKDVERFGTGLKRISEECANANVKYEFVTNQLGFKVIFYRKPIHEQQPGKVVDGVVDGVVDNNIPAKITDKENEIIKLIQENSSASAPEMAKRLGVTQQAVSKRIASLKKKEILRREGTRKNGKWIILEKE